LIVAQQQRPHIVITDIVMPVLDGLELAKRIREELPETQVILLTLYQEFDYAREAIHSGVTEYLVKGIYSDHDLLQALESAASRVRPEPVQVEPDGRLHRPSLGRILEDPEYQYDADELPQFPFFLALLKLYFRGERSIRAADEIARISDRVRARLGTAAALPTSDEIHLYLATPSHAQARESVYELGKELESSISAASVGACIGSRVGEIDSYRRATWALRDATRASFYRPQFELLPPEPPGFRPLDPEHSLSLSLAFRRACSEKETLTGFLRRELPEFAASHAIDPAAVKWLLDSWRSEIADHPEDHVVSRAAPTRPATVFDYAESLLALAEEGSTIYDRRYEVREIERYVAEHLDEKVSLEQAADHVGLTPNYLGALFKRSTGTGFKQYVTRARMERAGRLLRETNLLVYEVAERVGIPSYRYFSRVFHDHYGRSPQEYRSS
jgi:two-component system response regulator YesN